MSIWKLRMLQKVGEGYIRLHKTGKEIGAPREISARVSHAYVVYDRPSAQILQELLLQQQAFPLLFTSFWVHNYAKSMEIFRRNNLRALLQKLLYQHQ